MNKVFICEFLLRVSLFMMGGSQRYNLVIFCLQDNLVILVHEIHMIIVAWLVLVSFEFSFIMQFPHNTTKNDPYSNIIYSINNVPILCSLNCKQS